LIEYIAHRKNTREALKQTPSQYGIEVDIRSFGEELIIHHDPFVKGESFEEWLQDFHHGTLILNVKEEGLENQLIALMQKHAIEKFFFLDQSFPFLIRCANKGERRCAVRVSEYESIETALSLSGKVEWVWIDCFHHFPLSSEDSMRLINAGLKLCLVSPELQGRNPETEIPAMFQVLQERTIQPHAVCTKQPDLWIKV